MEPDRCNDGDGVENVPNDGSVVPLTSLNEGETGTIVHITSGQNAFMRLCHLGLLPGTKVVKMQSAPFHGPVRIKVRQSYLAIGRGIANRIMVRKGDV